MERDATLPFATTLVCGEGSAKARVCFIGEAPGAEEEKTGRPFVGRSGQLLRKHIRENFMREEDVYITNIVKRRPPSNRDPRPEEIAQYAPYLKKELSLLSPRVIVTLGRFAMNYFLPEGKITRDQGKVFMVDGVKIYPIFHPAVALRNPRMMKAFVSAMEKLPKVLSVKSKSKSQKSKHNLK